MEGLRWPYYAPNPLRGGASKGLRWKGGLGNHFLEAGAEPKGNENASEEAGQISHQFAESDDEEGSETHRERQVEVLRQLGPTM